jgi:glycine/D-amino acid oxidase-like deaminating enzyme
MLELLREGMRILDYIEQVIAAERIECHFRRCGRFRGAMRPEHYETMARDSEELRKAVGLESYMVPRAEVREEIGTDAFYGAMILPNDASLHPGLYHAGLMQRVDEAGGRIAGHAGVDRIEQSGKEFVLSTAAGVVRCRDVIVATDGYTDALLPAIAPRILAVGSAIIATAPLPEPLFDRLLPRNRVYGTTNRVFSYFRGAPAERRMLWGGRVTRFGAAASPRAFAHLAKEMVRIFPELRDVPVTHAWDGLIGQTLDYVPHIGRTAGGHYYALGYCGNSGVARATYLGHKVALKVLGDPQGRTAFDGLPFPRFPFHPIVRRAIPLIEAWMSLRDRFNF